MPRLVCVFAGRTGRFLGFVMLRLIFNHQVKLKLRAGASEVLNLKKSHDMFVDKEKT